jgi:hypothetical protein
MAIPFQISRENMIAGRSGAPGWYLLVVKSVTQGPGKNDPQSNVVTIDMSIVSGPDKSVIGAPVKHYLSEKKPERAVPFIEAVTGKRIAENGATPNLEESVGRKLKAHLQWDTEWKNWKCDDFMPESGQFTV